MNEALSELIAREEAKRDRNWNPAERWRVIQDTIAWAAEQETVRRNTPETCRQKEAMLLEGLRRAHSADASQAQ